MRTALHQVELNFLTCMFKFKPGSEPISYAQEAQFGVSPTQLNTKLYSSYILEQAVPA